MRPVTSFNGELQDLIDDMIETMRDANGVGLAAPQINRNLQLSVIETLPKHDDDGREIPNSAIYTSSPTRKSSGAPAP